MNPPTSERPPHVLHTRSETGVHTLVLNRGKALNVLSHNMLAALLSALDVIALDDSARIVVIAAEGKAFCAGHDLKAMHANTQLADHQNLFAQCTRMMLSIHNLAVPVIAKVQGLATAAGCQLVAQCDLAVAADTATFGVNGIDVGLFCATPSVPLVRNIPAKQAMEMLLTGGFISADEAKSRGLVNRVVPLNELDAETEKLVNTILLKPREAIRIGKALFYRQRETGIEAAYQLASHTMACNMTHPVARAGVQAFVEKRKPSWPL